MKYLKDPVWQFIGVVIALIVPVTIYLIDRPVKSLQVQILSNSPLVSINAEISPQIKILYKNKPLQTLSLILLRFENVGNEPIKESDYSEPTRIFLSPDAEVGEVTVQETKPEGIKLNPTVSASNQVTIAKSLLNPGDQAVLKILALNNDGTLKVEGRIVGIPEFKILSALESDPDRKKFIPKWLFFTLIGSPIPIVIFALIWTSDKVIKWRIQRYRFDPANYYYTLAQEAILSKDKTTGRISNTISNLGYAFKWDRNYIQRALKDPLFSQLQEYEKFKAVIDKYKQ